MKQYDKTRKSHCSVCGKRLSVETGAGKIMWQPARVDDSGIYCPSCKPPKKKNKGRKSDSK